MNSAIDINAKFAKLYYPYDVIVKALGLQDFELTLTNRPTCLSGINHDFFYIAKLFYLTLCEEESYIAKLTPILNMRLSPIKALLVMIRYAREAGFSLDKIISLLSHKQVPLSQSFTNYCSIRNGICVIEYGITTSHPEICAWRHPYLPLGSLIPNIDCSFESIIGLSSPVRALEVLDAMTNLKPGTRYLDIVTLKYKNGTEHAVQYNSSCRIMCSEPVKGFPLFVAMLGNKATMELFRDWFEVLAFQSSTHNIVSPPQVSSPPKFDSYSPEPALPRSSNERHIIPTTAAAIFQSSPVATLSPTPIPAVIMDIANAPPKPKRKHMSKSMSSILDMDISKPKAPVQKKLHQSQPQLTIPSTVSQPPKDIRTRIWRRHFNTFTGQCWCCGKEIDYDFWHCSHILANVNGGTKESSNLVPCCIGCNQGMGTMHMYDYIKTYYPKRLQVIGWSEGHYPVPNID